MLLDIDLAIGQSRGCLLQEWDLERGKQKAGALSGRAGLDRSVTAPGSRDPQFYHP